MSAAPERLRAGVLARVVAVIVLIGAGALLARLLAPPSAAAPEVRSVQAAIATDDCAGATDQAQSYVDAELSPGYLGAPEPPKPWREVRLQTPLALMCGGRPPREIVPIAVPLGASAEDYPLLDGRQAPEGAPVVGSRIIVRCPR